jgi:hypothetical protein
MAEDTTNAPVQGEQTFTLSDVQRMIDEALEKQKSELPAQTFTMENAAFGTGHTKYRKSSVPVTVNCGGDVFTYGGQHRGPGVFETFDLDEVDSINAAIARLNERRMAEHQQFEREDAAIREREELEARSSRR